MLLHRHVHVLFSAGHGGRGTGDDGFGLRQPRTRTPRHVAFTLYAHTQRGLLRGAVSMRARLSLTADWEALWRRTGR